MTTHTIQLSESARALLEMLLRGKKRARRRRDLARALTAAGHHTDERHVSILTNELIHAGYPVASTRRGGGGVFLCANDAERQEYSAMLSATFTSVADRLRHFNRAAYESVCRQQGVLGFMR